MVELRKMNEEEYNSYMKERIRLQSSYMSKAAMKRQEIWEQDFI